MLSIDNLKKIVFNFIKMGEFSTSIRRNNFEKVRIIHWHEGIGEKPGSYLFQMCIGYRLTVVACISTLYI